MNLEGPRIERMIWNKIGFGILWPLTIYTEIHSISLRAIFKIFNKFFSKNKRPNKVRSIFVFFYLDLGKLLF